MSITPMSQADLLRLPVTLSDKTPHRPRPSTPVSHHSRSQSTRKCPSMREPGGGEENGTVEVKTSKSHSLIFLRENGVLYPPLPDYDAHLRQLREFSGHPEDTWICGYPKSGSHWTWEVVRMILRGQPVLDDDVMEDSLVDFTDVPSTCSESRVLASHLPLHQSPAAVRCQGNKVIYVLRNPKDVSVSAYNHLASVTEDFGSLDFSEFLELFSAGNLYYGDWYDHVTAWSAFSRANPHVLVVKYEDMKQDLVFQVRRLATFLGREVGQETARDIARVCSFSNMRSCKAQSPPRWRHDALITSLYRKGEVGDWRNWFTPEQNDLFDLEHQRRLEGTGVTVTFDLPGSFGPD